MSRGYAFHLCHLKVGGGLYPSTFEEIVSSGLCVKRRADGQEERALLRGRALW